MRSPAYYARWDALAALGMKECRRCEGLKPLSAFGRASASRDGRRPYCRPCATLQTADLRAKDPEKHVRHAAAYYQTRRAEHLRKGQEWRRANPDAARRLSQRNESARRARQRGAFDELIDRNALWARDGGQCGICKSPASANDFHVDHIIPLARGGRHSYANTQVAHPACNLAKQDKIGEEWGNARADHTARLPV